MDESLPKLTDVIRSHGLRAKKSLGQNFLLDPSILSHIVKAAGPINNRTVIEVGPGPGGLTRAILDRSPKELYVIEMDKTCVDIMEQLQEYYPNILNVIEADALKIDCTTLGDRPRHIISNLPYNISVPLLFQWVEHIDQFEGLTLMFQKEVAKRILAEPRSSDYGKLSVMVQWCCDAFRVFDLPPGAFSPPPKVTSTVVHIRPKTHRVEIHLGTLEKITQAAFNQRRKMLRSSLKSLLPSPSDLLATAGIDPTRRAEELTVAEFCHIAQVFDNESKNLSLDS